MLSTTKITPPRLGGPAAIVIVLLIVITGVLVVTGMPPMTALVLTSCAGVAGAMSVRAATAGSLTVLVHRALLAVQASALA
ncbi:hypothetical protein [Streptomyces sp. NPDC058294]|uniref:hypothetical protein n=1 Tax=Streptomyces sp. NPDC058294 TaxID=3346430 RepID=UPI0036E9C3B9